MAKIISYFSDYSNLGEKAFFQAAEKFLPNEFIVYHRREIFGREFDFCILMPNVGIVIVEVKGWNEQTFLQVENDYVFVKYDGEKKQENPKRQARAYRFDMLNLIRKHTNLSPLVFDMVCYPFITKKYFYTKRLDVISAEELTFLREDFESEEAFRNKLHRAYSRAANWGKPATLDENMIKRIRYIFESGFAGNENPDKNVTNPEVKQESGVLTSDRFLEGYYSMFQFISPGEPNFTLIIKDLLNYYIKGTKIYLVVSTKEQYAEAKKEYFDLLNFRQLRIKKGDLLPALDNKYINNFNIDPGEKAFSCFNIQICLYEQGDIEQRPSFRIIDGYVGDEKTDLFLQKLHQNSEFNYYQYKLEHEDPSKNILVKAGAGTGKTYSMISRITYLCYSNNYSPNSLSSYITMITFTNEAAENMKKRLKACFQNYYLLTRNYQFFCFREQVERMQISTIHKFAKKLIEQFGSFLGYGKDLSIVSGTYDRMLVLERILEDYIKEMSDQGRNVLQAIGIPVYELKRILMQLITRLYSKSINLIGFQAFDLGEARNGDHSEFHELLRYVIQETEKEYSHKLQENNYIHLNELMVKIDELVQADSIALAGLQTRYMFIDEFQDTDDVQIKMLRTMQQKVGFKFFVVGDIKQCIYRFRGAEVEAFDKLKLGATECEWSYFLLNKNYRTDMRLLKAYEKVFEKLGSSPHSLLVYHPEKDKLFSDLCLNGTSPQEKFFKKQIYTGKNNDPDSNFYECLFAEVKKCQSEIKGLLSQGMKLSEAERTIAILVRDNWQAEEIKKQSPNYGIPNVKTHTGGELYQSLAAREMYKLILALLYNDSPRHLANFICTNYLNLSIDMLQLKLCEGADKVAYLTNILNEYFSKVSGGKYSWSEFLSMLRTEPILRVIKTIVDICKPWQQLQGEKDLQLYYKVNTELLLEKFIEKCSIDYLTLNSLGEHFRINILTRQEEETRNVMTEPDEEDISIICSTVHKSKGLEYGYVILPYTAFRIDMLKRTGVDVYVDGEKIGYSIALENQFIRNNYYDESQESLAHSREETRILYVAMTRAIRSFCWLAPEEMVTGLSWASLLEGSMGR